MALGAFLDYILTFEDLSEEQLEMLLFSNERSSITIQQAMLSDGFSCFYIKVKGLASGAKSIKKDDKVKSIAAKGSAENNFSGRNWFWCQC